MLDWMLYLMITFYNAQEMKFSIKDIFSVDLVTFTEKSLMENFIFCAVLGNGRISWMMV